MPISNPWPRYKAQTSPSVDSASPAAIMTVPIKTMARMPIRSASQPIGMPPNPVPTQTSAPARAITLRSVANPSCIGFKPTTTSNGAP